MSKNDDRYYSVGEIAQKSGATIRTLQFYDKCGLLSPSQYTEGGRRLYGWSDLIRLQQILFLKSFGFSLDEIKDRMRIESSKAFGTVLEQQREVLAGQVKNLQEAVKLLDKVIVEIRVNGEVGTEQLVAIIEMMKNGSPYSFIIRYFDNDQLRKLIDVNKPGMPSAAVAPDWQEAFDRVIEMHHAGVDPRGREGQEFAAHWWGMVMKSTGGDPELIRTMMDMGKDVDSWPEEVADFKEAVKAFLAEAMSEYFLKNHIGKAGDGR